MAEDPPQLPFCNWAECRVSIEAARGSEVKCHIVAWVQVVLEEPARGVNVGCGQTVNNNVGDPIVEGRSESGGSIMGNGGSAEARIDGGSQGLTGYTVAHDLWQTLET